MRLPGLKGPSVPLLVILLAAAGLRLLYIDAPLLDAHRWRQVDTAQVARFFYEDRFNPFKPEVNWGGAHGYVESEFPLLPALIAAGYAIAGPSDVWARLVVVLFAVATVALTYVLTRDLLDEPAGLAAAALVAASPSAVFYGRTVMPDTLMICFSLGAVIGVLRYANTGNVRALAWGSAALGLAILVKLPAIIVAAPIAALAWSRWRWAALGDRRLWLAVLLPLVVSAAWYGHAYGIYRETGLTFGVIGTTKTYPAYFGNAVWPDAFSKWSTFDLLTGASFYTTMLSRLYFLHLTPVGFVLSVIGWLMWRTRRWRVIPDAWLAAMAAFMIAAGHGHMGHDYYQLPLVPIAAIYFGIAGRPLFDPVWLRQHLGGGVAMRVVLGVCLLMLAGVGVWQSGVIDRHFRPDAPDLRSLQAGTAIKAAMPDKALVVVVDDYGVNSPMLLYFAHARGWSIDAQTATPQLVAGFQAAGARYFATTRWSQIKRMQPELTRLLETRRAERLAGAPNDTALFDLTSSN